MKSKLFFLGMGILMSFMGISQTKDFKFRREIGQLDSAGFIKKQQAFDHAVQEHLLLGLDLKRSLLL